MPAIRVFSSNNVELAPCNEDRASSLVSKDKATFIVIDNQKAIRINKAFEKTNAKEITRNEQN